ncbi:hypothetical protein Tco_1290556, partial [Tanacetum coccineum]
IPPEQRSGISINTISTAGEASSAVARLGYHVKFNDVIPLKVTYKPAPPRNKKTTGITSHPEEEQLSDLPRLSNPYLEKPRRTFMMALSYGHFLILISFLKRPRSPAAADAGNISALLHFTCLYQIDGTTMSQAQGGGGGSCVPNMDILDADAATRAEMKEIQDAIIAGTIPPKTDREILSEVAHSTNRAHIAGVGRKLVGTRNLDSGRSQPDPGYCTQENLEDMKRQQALEKEEQRKAFESQQNALKKFVDFFNRQQGTPSQFQIKTSKKTDNEELFFFQQFQIFPIL